MPRVRLFLTDIDGCLAEPYRPFDLRAFARLRAWIEAAETDPTLPRLGLCSGRAYGYVEAVAQALGLRGPALFESGGGRFDLPAARIRWSEALTPAVEAQLAAVRAFFARELVPRGGFALDYGKRAQASIVSTDPEALARAVADTRAFLEAEHPDLLLADTPVSIDVVPRTLSKRAAVEALAAEEGVPLAEMAFMGDTHGDLPAMQAVGVSFAPANAQPAVRAAADVVTRGRAVEGLLEAFRWCVRRNRAVRDRA